MARAIWNGVVVAESDQVVRFDNNVYFPPNSLHREHFRDNPQKTVCPWKGEASYHDLVVGDQTNAGAAWDDPTPLDAAAQIKDHVAFWKGVTVED